MSNRPPPCIGQSWFLLNSSRRCYALSPTHPRLPPPERWRTGDLTRDPFIEPLYPYSAAREPRIFTGPFGADRMGHVGYPGSWEPRPEW